LSQELTSAQVAALERLVADGFQVVAFPLYASMIGVRRDRFAALVEPAGGGLRLFNQPCCLIDGNFSVRIHKGGQSYFVWKNKSIEATPVLLSQLDGFADDLQRVLSSVL
jgi:hypothetical protein